MSQKLRIELTKWAEKNEVPVPKRKKRRKKKQREKPKEKLSQADLEELMGMNRPTYKRGRGGAMRQK